MSRQFNIGDKIRISRAGRDTLSLRPGEDVSELTVIDKKQFCIGLTRDQEHDIIYYKWTYEGEEYKYHCHEKWLEHTVRGYMKPVVTRWWHRLLRNTISR